MGRGSSKKGSLLVAGSTFDRKACLESKGGISLVKSDDVGRRCSRGLLVGEIHPSSDFGRGGRSMQGGRVAGGAGVFAGTKPAVSTYLQPQRGKWEGRAGGKTPDPHRRALTPRRGEGRC